MPGVSVRTSARTTGHADLRVISRRLREMNDTKVKDLFRRNLEPAAGRFVPPVRASVMAIPTTGEKHTGLRARIAACAEVASWEPGPRQVNVAVEMNPKRMPWGEYSLPLNMEGAPVGRRGDRRWRHPVFGDDKVWVSQTQHPYFYRAARGFGPAARDALGKALDDITRQLNG